MEAFPWASRYIEGNEKTIAAMREARAGKLPRFKNAKDLLRELNEGD